MHTNMTILKCPEYSCLLVCNVDDIKIEIDWICTRSELLIKPETNEHRTKTGKQIYRTKTGQLNTSYEDGKLKQINIENHIYLL
jgi:hypothetical protein